MLKKKKYANISNGLIRMLEKKDPVTAEHSRNVARYSVDIGTELNFSRSRLTRLYYMGLLHDVGKLFTPDAILKGASLLNEQERAIIKAHVDDGAELLYYCNMRDAAMAALYHQEYYDGNGYNQQLTHMDIPLESRIISVADAYDAMTSHRPYRPAMDMEAVIRELKRNAGTQFDPLIVSAIIKLIEEAVL